jgi:Na+/glutamate symporter
MLLLAALLILLAVTIPTMRFCERDYRADELNAVHAGAVLDATETAQWMARFGTHPAGWRIPGVYCG